MTKEISVVLNTDEKKNIKDIYEALIKHIDTEIGNLIQFRNDSYRRLNEIKKDEKVIL